MEGAGRVLGMDAEGCLRHAAVSKDPQALADQRSCDSFAAPLLDRGDVLGVAPKPVVLRVLIRVDE